MASEPHLIAEDIEGDLGARLADEFVAEAEASIARHAAFEEWLLMNDREETE